MERRLELSKRLRAVAELVPSGEILADVGTDHAYVPVWLVREGRILEAIAMDVNAGPLRRAEENIRSCGLDGKIRTLRCDGLKGMRPGEASCGVIAGMGGGLMIRILEDSPKTASAFRFLVLQPQSEVERVRRFLSEHGFEIDREDMVCEDGKYYPMMRVRPRRDRSPEDRSPEDRNPGDRNPGDRWPGEMTVRIRDPEVTEELSLFYGPLLLAQRHPVLREYLLREQEIREGILERLAQSGSEKSRARCETVLRDLERTRRALALFSSH